MWDIRAVEKEIEEVLHDGEWAKLSLSRLYDLKSKCLYFRRHSQMLEHAIAPLDTNIANRLHTSAEMNTNETRYYENVTTIADRRQQVLTSTVTILIAFLVGFGAIFGALITYTQFKILAILIGSLLVVDIIVLILLPFAMWNQWIKDTYQIRQWMTMQRVRKPSVIPQ